MDWQRLLKTVGLTLKDCAFDVLNSLMIRPAGARLANIATAERSSPWLSQEFWSARTVDGAIVGGSVPPGAWAKFTLPKGLPIKGTRRLAVEGPAHEIDGFSGQISFGYGKGIKTLLYRDMAIVKIGLRTFPGKVEYHFHEADVAGPHHDLCIEGVPSGTKEFEINIPNGDFKGRYAFRTTAKGVVVVPMVDRGLVLPKPQYNLKPVEFLKNLPPGKWISEVKLDGCFSYKSPVLCWDGKTIPIGRIVKENLDPIIVGFDSHGNPIPDKIMSRYDNGKKNGWVKIRLSCKVKPRGGKGFGAGRKFNDMIVTSNHVVWINGSEKSVGEACVGDLVTSIEFSFSENLRPLVLGGLLGDGSICANGNSHNYQEPHTNKEYVEQLNQCFGSSATNASSTTSGYGSELHWLRVRCYPEFSRLRNIWYPQGIKKIPQDLSWMDDIVVAKWYMDDGSLAINRTSPQQDRALFATNCFSKEDVDRLASKLEEMYGVSCTTYNSKGWCLRVNAGSNYFQIDPEEILSRRKAGESAKSIAKSVKCHVSRIFQISKSGKQPQKPSSIKDFWSRISPFVVPSMRYKLPREYRDQPFKGLPSGNERLVSISGEILSVTKMPDKDGRWRKNSFDLETTTHSYVCHGIRVHNSLGIANIHESRATFRSHRDTGETYYDRLPQLEFLSNQSRFLTSRLVFSHPNVNGTVFKGELVHSDGAPRMSGILNALPHRARQIQALRGPARFYAWDISKLRGYDVSRRSYEERRALTEATIKEIRLFNKHWDIVDKCPESQDPYDFYQETVNLGLPYGEGIVVKDASRLAGEGTWFKVKARDTLDLKVAGFIQGTGKFQDSVGAIIVEGNNGNFGEVGSFRINDTERKYLWDNRESLIGETAEILAMELTEKGIPRAGVFIRFHGDKSSENTLKMYAESLAGSPRQAGR